MRTLIARRRGILYASAFLMDFGATCGYTMLFVFLKEQMDAPLGTQGLLPLLQLLVYLTLCPLLGRLARPRGRRMAFFVVGPAVLAGGYFLIGRASAVLEVAGLMWITATGAAFFWPQLEAEIGHGASGPELGRRMGRFNLAWSAGSTAAPAIGGVLYDHHQRLPFALAALSGMLIAGLLVLYRALARRAEEASVTVRDRSAPATTLAAGTGGLADPPSAAALMPALLVAFVWLGWFGNFVSYSNQSVTRSLFQNLGKTLHYSATEIGVIMSALGVVRTLAFLVLERFHGWVYRARYLFGFQGLTLLGLVCLSVPGAAVVAAAGMALVGLGSAMAYTASLFYSVEGAHHGKASTGLHEMVLGGGGAFGLFFAGQVAPRLTHADPRSPFSACAALTAVCLALQVGVYVHYRRRRRRRAGDMAV